MTQCACETRKVEPRVMSSGFRRDTPGHRISKPLAHIHSGLPNPSHPVRTTPNVQPHPDPPPRSSRHPLHPFLPLHNLPLDARLPRLPLFAAHILEHAIHLLKRAAVCLGHDEARSRQRREAEAAQKHFLDISPATQPWSEAPALLHQLRPRPPHPLQNIPMRAPGYLMAVSKPLQKPAPDAVSDTRGNRPRNCGIARMTDTTP